MRRSPMRIAVAAGAAMSDRKPGTGNWEPKG
jgi:hypothetical protein